MTSQVWGKIDSCAAREAGLVVQWVQLGSQWTQHPPWWPQQPIGEKVGKQEARKGMVMAQSGEVACHRSHSYCMLEVGTCLV